MQKIDQKIQHLLNNQIRANKILLLDTEGEKIGEFSFKDAMDKAFEQELDLVQVGNSPDVAICKLLKYDSWIYHEKKRKDKQEFKNRSQELKAMNFRPMIGENDFQIKIKKIADFLQENHKVKIIIKLKNREFTMRAINDVIVDKIVNALKDHGTVDAKINWSSKEINFMLKPERKPFLKMKI